MTLPAAVAVIGGGRMGAGIAQLFATGGADVTVVEDGAEAGQAARGRIETGLARAAERGTLTEAPEKVLDRIELRSDPADIPATVGLVIEAVPEVAELKVAMLAAAETAVGESAVLASNTSSLSINELSAALHRPERFLGLHFFNPVPVSQLVEVVIGPRTADVVRDLAVGWVRALDRTEVVVRDSPGFATSRLGVLLGLEAIRMLEEGVADAASIDTAMELGYRHPMGPLRSSDLIGLDVRLAVAEYLHSRLGDRFAPPQLLRDKVTRGELGRKTGRGFYEWR